jgi:hypothetical protein
MRRQERAEGFRPAAVPFLQRGACGPATRDAAIADATSTSADFRSVRDGPSGNDLRVRQEHWTPTVDRSDVNIVERQFAVHRVRYGRDRKSPP